MPKFILGNSLYLEVQIGDIDLYLNPGNIKGIYVIQNRQLSLPMLTLILDDVNGEIESTYPLYDGIPITITFGSNDLNDNPDRIEFRIFGAPKSTPNGSKTQLTISALLDAPKFLTDLPKKEFLGPSSSVMTSVADICGFESDVRVTDDSQYWVPLNRTYANFVQKVSQHGWTNNTSLMLTALTEKKYLRYYNITEQFANEIQTSFNYGLPPDDTFKVNIDCNDYEIRNSNGLSNNYIGYGLQFVEEELTGNATTHDSILATKQSNFFEVNKEIKDSILDNLKYEYTPINCGNIHDNYTLAYYQNRRLKAFYATKINLFTETTTNVELLDVVNLNLIDKPTKQNNLLFKGKYIVTAKTRAVVGPRYFEKFQLESTGRNLNVQNRLI